MISSTQASFGPPRFLISLPYLCAELYGGLGSDSLDGGVGNDILVGDIGYAVRRFNSDGSPTLTAGTEATPSSFVWKKDVILEELGHITSVQRISSALNTTSVQAEAIMQHSLLFVASAMQADGSKYLEGESGTWAMDFFGFDLVPAGDDNILCGGGNDVAFGSGVTTSLKAGLVMISWLGMVERI